MEKSEFTFSEYALLSCTALYFGPYFSKKSHSKTLTPHGPLSEAFTFARFDNDWQLLEKMLRRVPAVKPIINGHRIRDRLYSCCLRL